MERYLIFFLICLPLVSFSQDKLPGYNLEEGTRYTLNITVQQNTVSESYDSGGEISLDQKMSLHIDVISILDDATYSAIMSYENLFLSMLAPTMNIDINSGTGRNRILSVLIDSLESQSFRIHLNRDGSIIMLDDINEFFFRMYDHIITTEAEQDVIIKTLREAFGSNAFSSISNIFINLYPSSGEGLHWEKEFNYYFNTKPVRMVNRFYLIKQTEERITIQGMGMIETIGENEDVTNGSIVNSSAAGSQTFDLQMDPETGWMIYGASRQRILIKTTIVKDPYLPTGLEIPSYTETVFSVEGRFESER